jgi:hypothetical protein
VLARALDELRGRQDLAARDARHVRHQAFDLTDLAFGQPFFELRHGVRTRMETAAAAMARATTPPENIASGVAEIMMS